MNTAFQNEGSNKVDFPCSSRVREAHLDIREWPHRTCQTPNVGRELEGLTSEEAGMGGVGGQIEGPRLMEKSETAEEQL